MMQPRNRKICLLAIVGTMLLASHCKSHQMNISNTWTLPQDGFTVFYRFFRDKISWYEADAVCQFHHANLVTVDNGVKYDASRAFLSDLNVTENVWIGLMRSQNSDRFMWSNSKILDREFGYWAEQIPAIESPLCAVVDPMRDYRWHSLRCGGPDVGAFLCEMEAPEWATECLIRALPSLTIQYLADSATIELSRDCGAEGIKRLTCNGKQDQDMIQRELMCLLERESITSDNEMRAAAAAAAAAMAAAASAEEIPSDNVEEPSQSDNTENNNIDKIANQIEASVDKLGDKFNLDEVMMGDAPVAESQETDDIVKPVKSSKKIASEKPLKNQPKQMRKVKNENKDDLMMGDQPVPDDEVLPHVKKFINTDLKKTDEIPTTQKSVVEIQRTTIEVRSRRETENPVKPNISATTTESNIKTESEVVHAPHKEITRDHFIPPMLLVQHQNSTPTPPPSSTVEHEAMTATILSITPEPNYQDNQTSSTQQTQVPTTTNDLTTISSGVETSSSILTTVTPNITDESSTISTTATHIQIPHEPSKANVGMRPHAPKFGGEIMYHAPNLPTNAKSSADLVHINHTNSISEIANSSETTVIAENASDAVGSSTVKPNDVMTQAINETVTEERHLEVAKRSNLAVGGDKHQHKPEQPHHKQDSHKHTDDMNTTHHADFTNSNLDYNIYKANRKRILTKPQTHTFIQKVFG